MQVIGLTGGIGMGKSTAAAWFRRAHIPVFDADQTVHRLQAPGGGAVAPIAAAFPETVTNGLLDRARLRSTVLADPAALRRLEAIIHPLVRHAERRFLAAARRRRAGFAVLDIPLLLETGGVPISLRRRVDFVVVVSAPRSVQIARVRHRRHMNEAQITAILARQMSDRERRRRADRVVQTGLSRHHAQAALRRLIQDLRQREPRR